MLLKLTSITAVFCTPKVPDTTNGDTMAEVVGQLFRLPANGKPIIVPSQDMVLGLYYLSLEKEDEPGQGMMLSDMAEVHQALAAGAVTLHSKIISRVPQTDEQGETYMKRFETTAGRMLLGAPDWR